MAFLTHTRRRAACFVVRAATETQKGEGTKRVEYQRPVRSKDKKDIYLGKGRVIKDDPSKYPDRNELGVGGWAGGELGLWSFRDQVKVAPAEEAPQGGIDIGKITSFLGSRDEGDVKKFKAKVNGVQVEGEVRGTGDDMVYIGREKSERATPGKPGKFIMDNARKYPDKEDFGIIYGATGGFAGGEQGLQQFVEKGDVDLLPPGTRRRAPPNPLVILFTVTGAAGLAVLISSNSGGDVISSIGSSEGGGVAATGGGVLRTSAAGGFSIDSNTLILVQVGLVTLAGTGAVVGGRAAITSARKWIAEATKGSLVYALYFGCLILALKAVLEI